MKKIISYLLILSLAFLTICPIGNVEIVRAKTLQDYKNEVAKLETQQSENNRLTTETKNKINAKRNAILSANDTIAENEQKVEDAKVKVAESQESIRIKTAELKELLQLLQYIDVDSTEVYVDYVFDSSSISEMIERQAVIEQVVEYTYDELGQLNDLIVENEQLQVDLKNENVNLENSIVSYESQVEELEAYIETLATIGLDYDEQIKAQKSLIKTFEDAGCKNTDSVDDCYYNKQVNSSSFSRPLVSGRVTQAWGNNGHKGIDLGGNKKGTNIYAPANGTVAHVAYKQSCGGNIIYMHHQVAGVAYTTEFAHLTAIYVKDGDYVRKGDVIATVGGDSSTFYYDHCTSGTHLHYAIAYGYYLGSGKNGYSKWKTFTTNTKATNVKSVSGFNNKKGWTWSSR